VSVDLVLRAEDGTIVADEVHRWFDDATLAERGFLSTLRGPVLDVGCGPGRLVAALHELGTPSLGIDIAPAAIELTRDRGASALARSVFDRLPGEGRWATAILADGNIGIGGNPSALLARLAVLVRPGGEIAVEVDRPGRGLRHLHVRIERDAEVSGWFPWATADDATVRRLGARFELFPCRRHDVDDRSFTVLRHGVVS